MSAGTAWRWGTWWRWSTSSPPARCAFGGSTPAAQTPRQLGLQWGSRGGGPGPASGSARKGAHRGSRGSRSRVLGQGAGPPLQLLVLASPACCQRRGQQQPRSSRPQQIPTARQRCWLPAARMSRQPGRRRTPGRMPSCRWMQRWAGPQLWAAVQAQWRAVQERVQQGSQQQPQRPTVLAVGGGWDPGRRQGAWYSSGSGCGNGCGSAVHPLDRSTQPRWLGNCDHELARSGTESKRGTGRGINHRE